LVDHHGAVFVWPRPSHNSLAVAMRIAHIQLMRESKLLYATRVPVAFALVASVLSLSASDISARSGDPGTAITGSVRVVDGDTISLGATRIRLEGIDAPEAAQSCRDSDGHPWPCGRAATTALERLLAVGPVSCNPRGLDKYGRTLAVCFVRGRDVNAEMVRQGYAWAFVRYSSSYVREEAEAKAVHRGIWQGEAIPAWDYRKGHWETAEVRAPNGCAIKGNITSHGRIYHMPWSPWYAQIKMESDKGKRWFCSEAEAIAAGWRPVQAH
jgi:endonuclease YncB( thermonuclease family)